MTEAAQVAPIVVQQSPLALILSAATPIILVLATALGNRLAKKINRKQDALAEVAKDTHTLVNSQMGKQLMLYAITARTLANLTQKPEHIKAAEEADRELAEHQDKQAAVDARTARMDRRSI